MNNTTPNKFNLAELQCAGPMLWEQVLRPGDVLLVRGNTPFSSLIVKASGGKYSHAAIWLPDGNTEIHNLFLAESDTSGVGFTLVYPMSLYQGGKYPADRVIPIPEKPTDWIILRHPECEQIDHARLLQASRDLQHNNFYKTYTALPRLLEAVKLPDFQHSLAKNVAQAFECIRIDKGTRGVFCSELVATFFSLLGLKLFPDDREPQTISPNDFLLEECYLVEVADAFVDTSNLPPGTYGWGYLPQDRKKDPHLRVMINRRSVADQLEVCVDNANSFLRESNARLKEQQSVISATIDNQFNQEIVEAELRNEYKQVEKLQLYAAMFKYGYRLQQCLQEYDDRQLRGDTFCDDITSWNDARSTLQLLANQIMSRAQSTLIRSVALSRLRRIRSIFNNSTLNRIRLAKLRYLRAKIIKGWREHKQQNIENLNFSKRLLATGALTEQAHAYIEDIYQTTFELLIVEFASQKL